MEKESRRDYIILSTHMSHVHVYCVYIMREFWQRSLGCYWSRTVCVCRDKYSLSRSHTVQPWCQHLTDTNKNILPLPQETTV